jgi:hypothetical protein
MIIHQKQERIEMLKAFADFDWVRVYAKNNVSK